MAVSVRGQLRRRAQALAAIRAWMQARDILEVDSPALWPWANTDPAIASLQVPGHGWLHTSPEFGMKRLLACGSGDIYQLSHVFRAEEDGPHHRCEFMMLEWYRLGLDHRQLAAETVALIQHLRSVFDLPSLREKTLTHRQLFLRFAGIDPQAVDEDELRARCQKHGLTGWHGRQAGLDFLLAVVIEPQLASDTLYTVLDYPPEQAALARIGRDEHGQPVAARFEIFQGGMELANGYHELSDGQAYRQRFRQENRRRQETGQNPLPLDEPLCALLERQPLPDCAGVALGFDRLLMALFDQQHIGQRWPAVLEPRPSSQQQEGNPP